MSVRISDAIWRSGPRNPTRRYVLLAIADNADDSGFAWPEQTEIADKTQLSIRAVREQISDLEREGWLTVIPKARGHKGNTYQIALEKLTFRKAKSEAPGAGESKSQRHLVPVSPARGAESEAPGAGDYKEEPSLTVIEPSNTKREAALPAGTKRRKLEDDPYVRAAKEWQKTGTWPEWFMERDT